MIKGLIFDLDNTLIDRQKAFSEMLWRKLRTWFNDKNLIQQMIQDILLFDNNGAVERVVAFQKWIDKYHIDFITAQQFASDWSKESGGVTYLFDDVKDTLKILKENYRIMILSNGNKTSQRRKIESIAINDLIDYSLISSEYGISKPDPRIFQYVCQQNNLKPEECIYIGDTYQIDVLGAQNAGLHAIYVSRFNEVHADVPTIYQIADLLTELQKYK